MNAPAQPIFRSGQRLTADQLNHAFKYLSDALRCALLAPLSAGVAGGLEISPVYLSVASSLTIAPGAVIDGRGRYLLFPDPQTFSYAQVAASSPVLKPLFEIRARAVERQISSSSPTTCAQSISDCLVVEGEIFFRPVDYALIVPTSISQFADPNCVEPWEGLDAPTSEDCSILIGHVALGEGSQLTTTTFFRQGVAPRFSVIRNSDGVPSIYLAKLEIADVTDAPIIESALAVAVPALFQREVIFQKTTAFLGVTGGSNLQATHVAPFGAQYATGTYGRADSATPLRNARVFAFGGGVNALDGGTGVPAGRAGSCAIPCELVGSAVTRAGIPLCIATTNTNNGTCRVTAATDGTLNDSLIGLSAGPSYPLPGGGNAVLVVTRGVVRAEVWVDASESLAAGDPLAVKSDAVTSLKKATTGERVVGKNLRTFTQGVSPGTIEANVWALDPYELP